ncbi:putative hypothetical protein [Streptomyces sp. NBRC 110611]|nr:putative hypothetical protein [Streptomyces sp. NBRC 110611]
MEFCSAAPVFLGCPGHPHGQQANCGALIATDGHLFWVPDLKKWGDAGEESVDLDVQVALDRVRQVQKGNGVVAIGLRLINSLAADVSGSPFHSRRHNAWARKDQEVLIFQSIPARAITRHGQGG